MPTDAGTTWGDGSNPAQRQLAGIVSGRAGLALTDFRSDVVAWLDRRVGYLDAALARGREGIENPLLDAIYFGCGRIQRQA